jgi:hypothetical protein
LAAEYAEYADSFRVFRVIRGYHSCCRGTAGRHRELAVVRVSRMYEHVAEQCHWSLREIHAQLPARSDELLNRANALVTARASYDYDSVARLVSDEV